MSFPRIWKHREIVTGLRTPYRGEIVVDPTNHRAKVGDGVLITNALPWLGDAKTPFFDPRDFGGVLDKTVDNTAAINAAATAAAAAGGGTVLVPGRMGFAGTIIIPNLVNLFGFGPGIQSLGSYGSSVLFALHANAQLVFATGGRGGVSGGFSVHGNQISDRTDGLLNVAGGAHKTFNTISVSDTIGTAIFMSNIQNSVFVHLVVSRVQTGNAFVFHDYVRSNTFMNCSARIVGGCHYLFDKLAVDSITPPSNNVFINPILEEAWDNAVGAQALIRVNDSSLNSFVGATLVGGKIVGADSAIQINKGQLDFHGSIRASSNVQARSTFRVSADGDNQGGLRSLGFLNAEGGNYGITYNGGTLLLAEYLCNNGAVEFDPTGTGNLATATGVNQNRFLPMRFRKDVTVTDTLYGFVLRSPDGTYYRLKVANGGALTTTAI